MDYFDLIRREGDTEILMHSVRIGYEALLSYTFINARLTAMNGTYWETVHRRMWIENTPKKCRVLAVNLGIYML